MKKLLISLTAVGLLAGCGSEEKDTVQDSPPETEERTEEDPVTLD